MPARRCPRTFAPAMMAAVVLLLAAVPARAQEAHGAIAFGQAHQAQAVAYGFAWGYSARDEAQEAAMTACLSGGGSDCTVLARFQNGCGALAVDQYGMAHGRGARSLEQAEARALRTCEAAGGVGCAVVGSQCVSPGGQPDTWSGSESVLAPPEEESGSTAGQTADRDRPATDAPRDEGLTRDERMRVQRGLAALGYDGGPADGMFGPRTRSAIGEWQQAKGLEATGYLSRDEAEVLAAASAESPLSIEGAPQPTPTPTLTTPQPEATPDDVQQTIVRDRYVMGIEAAHGAGEYAKVLTFVEKLRELGGELPLAVGYHQGVAYQELGRDEEAIQVLNRYLARYLQETGERGEHYQEVQKRLLALEDRVDAEGERYEHARTAGTAAAWGEYLKDYPQGRYAAEARRSQAQAQDDEAYERARQADTPASYGAYLREYPTGRHAADARRLQAAAERREEAERLRPGKRFRDCAECPELVVVAAGTYMMGSPASEEGRYDDEGPRHRVTIGEPFAVGVYEVTRGEYGRFVATTGRGPGGSCWEWYGEWKEVSGRSWRNPGYAQTDRHPVACVSWNDAVAYVRWLSRKTGESYRLLSEAEWEYAARAGTRTARYWGESSASQCRYGNGADQALKRQDSEWKWIVAECDDRYHHTAPVGSYEANEYGLYDVLGNLWEWTADCWNGSYAGAPSDGRAWEKGECGRRVARGGSWLDTPWDLRAAFRNWDGTGNRDSNFGFRVARTLDS